MKCCLQLYSRFITKINNENKPSDPLQQKTCVKGIVYFMYNGKLRGKTNIKIKRNKKKKTRKILINLFKDHDYLPVRTATGLY